MSDHDREWLGPDAVPDAGTTSDAERMLAACAEDLITAAEATLAPWVVRSVTGRWRDYTATDPEPGMVEAARRAGDAARDEIVTALRALLGTDAERQWTGPLAVLRRAVAYPTAVLREAGVPPVVRDEFGERNFPDDLYDLSPASFTDIDPSLHEPGLIWGAAKAHVVLTRRNPRL